MIALTLRSDMQRKMILMSCAVGATVMLLPLETFATTATDFGGTEIVTQATKIQAFLFGPTMRVAGVI